MPLPPLSARKEFFLPTGLEVKYVKIQSRHTADDPDSKRLTTAERKTKHNVPSVKYSFLVQ